MRNKWKIIVLFLPGVLLLSGCYSQHCSSAQRPSYHGNMTVEEIAKEANALYGSLIQDGEPKEKAMGKMVEYLKAQKNVKDVKVTGSETVRVFFTDGSDLLLMLGRDRM
jgi:hypothetical protein